MKRKLPVWCKEAKKKLIDLDMNVTELSSQIGICREYTSGVVNGRVYSRMIAEKISVALKIDVAYPNNLFE